MVTIELGNGPECNVKLINVGQKGHIFIVSRRGRFLPLLLVTTVLCSY